MKGNGNEEWMRRRVWNQKNRTTEKMREERNERVKDEKGVNAHESRMEHLFLLLQRVTLFSLLCFFLLIYLPLFVFANFDWIFFHFLFQFDTNFGFTNMVFLFFSFLLFYWCEPLKLFLNLSILKLGLLSIAVAFNWLIFQMSAPNSQLQQFVENMIMWSMKV